ncbi:hypothetical protein MBRA1_000730 [Malassezia brasiliensis]|uniref:RNA polymerase II-associated protein 1 C-terminal domain-containing protein n=1 Tax=Malassezia brasiliensis TaxID=1821822 RepID=A0AAF0DQC8_9BASI|nr:hypothetical protein MBRA1_000730 [Malassezia brasiliensis]
MSRAEQVRPRLVDLAEVEEEGNDALMNWPAAATVVRKPPPDVGAKQVRFAHAEDKTPAPDAPSGVDASKPADTVPIEKSFVPVMGAIRERTDEEVPNERRSAPRTSRFRAQRAMDRALDEGVDEHGKPLSAFRRSQLLKARQQSESSGAKRVNSNELAHKTDTLARAQAPAPSGARTTSPSASTASPEHSVGTSMPDPSRDPGGGAPPDEMAALLAQISSENAEKVSQMNYATVEDELRDAISFFGADTLAKLKARRTDVDAPGTMPTDGASSARTRENEAATSAAAVPDTLDAAYGSTTAPTAAKGWPALERRLADVDLGTQRGPSIPVHTSSAAELEAFRAKYFPQEPEAVNPSLAWMVSDDTSGALPKVRFDFSGDVSWRPGETRANDATYLAGLHHHGAQQHAPGYTIEELLHLVQSSVASQRTVALQVLGRICGRTPQRLANGLRGARWGTTETDPYVEAALDEDVSVPRAHILLSARWLLNDRHRSVRVAAIQCLAAAVQSVSVLTADDAVALGAWPVCAPPRTNWLWLASLHDDARWTPHDQPPYVAESDASYLELVRRNWAETLLQTELLPTLDALAAAHAGLDEAARGAPLASEALDTRAALLRLVYALVVHSAAAAHALPQHTHLVRLVAQRAGTACAWPLGDATSWPDACALAILLRCVEASREAADVLMGQGVLGGVLRYIVLPPVPPQTGAAFAREQALLYLAARLVTALARYEQCSTAVREVWHALQQLGPWAATSEALAAPAVLDMLAAWTHLALVAPQHGDLGVNWPAVRTWVVWSVQGVLSAAPMPTQTAALAHLARWVHVAQALEPVAIDDLAQRGEIVAVVDARVASLGKELSSRLAALHTARETHNAAQAQELLNVLMAHGQYLGAAAELMRATPAWGWQHVQACRDAQRTLLASDMPAMLGLPVLDVSGLGSAARIVLLASCGAGNLEELSIGGVQPAKPAEAHSEEAEDDTPASDTPVPASTVATDALVALSALPPQEGALARTTLKALVQHYDPHLWSVLQPFLCDALERAGSPPAPPFSLVRALQYAETPPVLAVPDMPSGMPEADSVTGADLWQLAASGLPLRPDWAFAALDDLLHSGHARALNRANALPPNWDYSEAEIVRATLQLAVRVVHTSLGARLPCLPQAAQVWLGIAKVFLLEQEQGGGPDGAYSGAATGRDLYTTEPVRRLLEMLVRLADCAACAAPMFSLEAAADALRTGVSFYQVYTDLVGLYDAVSLGDPLFALTLLPPLAMTYAPDYRRLLWSDYAHLLRTITTPLDAAPVATGNVAAEDDAKAETDKLCIPLARRVQAYLSPLETDVVVLGSYAQALLTGQVTEAQPLLYRIAVHHVSGALWASLEHWPA